MAQFGRALRSGRRGRRFESCHLDQNRTRPVWNRKAPLVGCVFVYQEGKNMKIHYNNEYPHVDIITIAYTEKEHY